MCSLCTYSWQDGWQKKEFYFYCQCSHCSTPGFYFRIKFISVQHYIVFKEYVGLLDWHCNSYYSWGAHEFNIYMIYHLSFYFIIAYLTVLCFVSVSIPYQVNFLVLVRSPCLFQRIVFLCKGFFNFSFVNNILISSLMSLVFCFSIN